MDISPVWPGAAKAAWSGDENARPDGPPTVGRAGAVDERRVAAERRPPHPSTSGPRRVVRLGYPPSAARLWRMAEGRIVKAADYRDWLAAACEAIRVSAHPAVVGPYLLHITVYRPTEANEARRDLDSLLGPLTAALTDGGLVGGEALADRIVVRWSGRTAPGGRLEVEARQA